MRKPKPRRARLVRSAERVAAAWRSVSKQSRTSHVRVRKRGQSGAKRAGHVHLDWRREGAPRKRARRLQQPSEVTLNVPQVSDDSCTALLWSSGGHPRLQWLKTCVDEADPGRKPL